MGVWREAINIIEPIDIGVERRRWDVAGRHVGTAFLYCSYLYEYITYCLESAVDNALAYISNLDKYLSYNRILFHRLSAIQLPSLLQAQIMVPFLFIKVFDGIAQGRARHGRSILIQKLYKLLTILISCITQCPAICLVD